MSGILITGAGSGLGKGAAIGIARRGHEVIAAAQTWPQVTALAAEVESLGLRSLRAAKLDVLDPFDVEEACRWDFDILVNNAGGPPVGDWRTFEREQWLAAADSNMVAAIMLIVWLAGFAVRVGEGSRWYRW